LPSAVVTTFGLNVDPLDNSVELQHANTDREDNEVLLNNKEILLPKDRADPNGRLHISEETPINVSICIDTDQHSLATVAVNNREQGTEPTIQLLHATTPCQNTSASQPTSEQEEGDDLQRFIDFVSGPASAPILHTPPNVNQQTDPPIQPARTPNTQQRKSLRLADKAKANVGLGSIQLAQQLLVKKLGDLVPGSSQKSDDTFESLVQRLPRPFDKATMEALQVLVEEGNKAKNKKKSRVTPVVTACTGESRVKSKATSLHRWHRCLAGP
jgi:hypothetical protein